MNYIFIKLLRTYYNVYYKNFKKTLDINEIDLEFKNKRISLPTTSKV